MKIALPITKNDGLNSAIAPNFRAAPALLVVDTENNSQRMVDTSAGVCSSVPDDIQIVIFTDGMGAGMFGKMLRKGMKIYQSHPATVEEALASYHAGGLNLVGAMECNCSDDEPHHHHHDHGDSGCCCH